MDFIPQLGNFYLDIINISDNFSFSVASHEYPFSNKNKLENIGSNTRRIKIKCIFSENPTPTIGWNLGNIQPTYNNHYHFLEYIRDTKIFTFIHPKYGTLEGAISTVTVNQDDTINYANMDFEFLVQDSLAPSYLKPIEAQESADFSETNTKTLALINAANKAARNARAWAAKTQLGINTLEAYANRVTSPATSIANIIYYATDLPSQFIEAVNFAVDRAIQPIIATYNSPSSMLLNMVVAVTQLKNTFLSQFPDVDVTNELGYITFMAASRVAYESAVIYEKDNKNKTEQDKRGNEKTFDQNGNFIGGVEYNETMTIDELDETCYNIKGFIDDAVQLNREQLALKNQGALLQKYINQIKLVVRG